MHTGGDIAFVNGVLKVLLAEGAIDREFVREHTTGFDAVLAELETRVVRRSRGASGATRADMERFAAHVRAADVRGARVVHGDHPARERRRQRARDREPRARARQRRTQGRRAHADPRSLGRPGRVGHI